MSILGRVTGNLPFRGGRGGGQQSSKPSAPGLQYGRAGGPPGPPPITNSAKKGPPGPPPPIPGQGKPKAERPGPPPIGGSEKNPNDPKWNRSKSHIEPRALSPEEQTHHSLGYSAWDKKSRMLSHETGTGQWKRDEPAHGGKYGDKSEYEVYGNPVGPRQEEQRHADKKAQEHRDALEGHKMATKRTGPPPIPQMTKAPAPAPDKKGPPGPPPIGKSAKKGPPGPPPKR